MVLFVFDTRDCSNMGRCEIMSYLIAVPGIRQRIGPKIFTIKRMYSSKEDALECVKKLRVMNTYREALLYMRRKDGKLFGRHPYCVAVWGKR